MMPKKEDNTLKRFAIFLFFLDDEWKLNFCGSFNSIMKTKTKFIINQLLGWYTIEQKKDNTHDKQET